MIKAAEKHVYFMKPVGMVGPIKIGCSSWPENRLKQLGIWSPFELEVIFSFPAGHTTERQLHRCFADLHSHGEWFRPGPRLLKAIEEMKSGSPVEMAVDLNDEKGSILKGRCGKRTVPPELEGYLSYSARLRHAAIKATREAGERRVIPDDVRGLLKKWEGFNEYRQPRAPIRPSDEEFRRFDEVIADPVKHCIQPSWIKSKPADHPVSARYGRAAA